ncbi:MULTISPECIES: phage tail protein [unclassified Bradyrhizobium]|uniref:phage tail protein n=1 Tax=unclassified Bradyrhizobium TaxID=2631580 RepID=UPI003399D5B0
MVMLNFPTQSFLADYNNVGGRGERVVSGALMSVTTTFSADDPTKLFDGDYSTGTFSFAAHTTGNLTIQFAVPQFIEEMTVYADAVTSQGPFVLQASQNGADWVDYAYDITFLAQSFTKIPLTPVNTIAYLYYRFVLDAGGRTAAGSIGEIDFKIAMNSQAIPVPGCDWKVSDSVSFAINENEFGDGFSQRSAQGMNNVRDTWSASWTNVSTREKETIVKFIRTMKGYRAFSWTAPGDAAPLNWSARDLKFTPQDVGYWSITSTFRQEFDL